MLRDKKSTHVVVCDEQICGFENLKSRFLEREPENAGVGEPNTGVRRNVVLRFDWVVNQ